MVDSLQDIIYRRGGPRTAAEDRFLATGGEDFVRQAYKGKAFSERRFTEGVMRFATRGMRVTPAEFGEAFGTVPFVMGEDRPGGVVSAMLGKAIMPHQSLRVFEEAIASGTAYGMPEVAFGGPGLDVGGMATLEPRTYEIMKKMGKEGQAVSEEFLERIVATTPKTLMAHQEINKTIDTLTGATTLEGGNVMRKGEKFNKFMERGGGRLPSPMGNIYIPGMEQLEQLRPFQTHTGVTTQGKLADIYGDIAGKVSAVEEGLITPETFRKDMGHLTDVLRREAAPAGKKGSAGAFTRGQMFGSRFLRAVPIQGRQKDAGTSLINRATYDEMFTEMVESGLYDADELKAQQTAFHSGERVPAVLWRHPEVGEFSIQPTFIKQTTGPNNMLSLPEIRRDISFRFKNAAGDLVNQSKSVTLGPLVGMSADFDGDAVALSLVSPDGDKALRKGTLQADSEYQRRHVQHQIRSQLFSAGKATASDDFIPLKRMMGDVEKLAVGQQWIAPLSTQITTAKATLEKFGQGAAAADARFLLQWLEENPIKAKHISSEQAGALQAQMMGIGSSLEYRNAEKIAGHMTSMVQANQTANAMLTQSVFLDSDSTRVISEATGVKMRNKLASVDIHAASKEIARTLTQGDEGFIQEMQFMTGKGARMKQKEIAELAAKSAFKSTGEAMGGMRQVVASFSSATNRLSSLGAGMIRSHKTIGLGFAGSLALATVLSEPPRTVGSGRAKIPDARLNMNRQKAASRMKPEQLHPAGKDVRAPTPPQIMRNQTTRISMGQSGGGARVVGRAPAGANLNMLAGGMASSGGSTSVNLRDSRSRLHPDEIASRLL
jgi:hypothetical protein